MFAVLSNAVRSGDSQVLTPAPLVEFGLDACSQLANEIIPFGVRTNTRTAVLSADAIDQVADVAVVIYCVGA